MKRLQSHWLALLCLLCFVATTSHAASKTPEEYFAKRDRNGDGHISKQEFVGKKTGDSAVLAGKRFARLDEDDNGKVSLEELEPYLVVSLSFVEASAQEKTFAKLDVDGDGHLSKEEWVGDREGAKARKAEKRFKSFDKHPDGALSFEEFKARHETKKELP
ncbi:MAG: EF-hand domain-containing protein [Deltaproteobacteria bacterium]|nr:EF-hand domain-containing protein [Deltaproteobacteria bacterium]